MACALIGTSCNNQLALPQIAPATSSAVATRTHEKITRRTEPNSWIIRAFNNVAGLVWFSKPVIQEVQDPGSGKPQWRGSCKSHLGGGGGGGGGATYLCILAVNYDKVSPDMQFDCTYVVDISHPQ